MESVRCFTIGLSWSMHHTLYIYHGGWPTARALYMFGMYLKGYFSCKHYPTNFQSLSNVSLVLFTVYENMRQLFLKIMSLIQYFCKSSNRYDYKINGLLNLSYQLHYLTFIPLLISLKDKIGLLIHPNQQPNINFLQYF